MQLSLKEDSTYADIREAVLAHERVTKGFSTEQILKQVQTSGEHDTSAPMEVDRIFKGGKDNKGKDKKGDGKGKGRGAFPVAFHGALDVEKAKENNRRASQRARKELERRDMASQKENRKEPKVVLLKGAGFVVIQGIGRKNALIVEESIKFRGMAQGMMVMAMIGIVNHNSDISLGLHNNSSRMNKILRSNVFSPNHDLHHHLVNHRHNNKHPLRQEVPQVIWVVLEVHPSAVL